MVEPEFGIPISIAPPYISLFTDPPPLIHSSAQRRKEMQGISSSSPLMLSASPSLTCYSSSNNTLADIAARVARELSLQDDELEGYVDDDPEDFFVHRYEPELPQLNEEEEEEDERGQGEDFDDDDVGGRDEGFEFSFICGDSESSPVSADEIFQNGQIRPMYDYSSLIDLGRIPRTDSSHEEHQKQSRRPRRAPLRLLMTEDDPRAGEPPEPGFSCSSSESDELEGVNPGTYCVWTPREASGQRCRKSSSAGSGSRRWKLKHLLLNRSNSDGRTDGLAVVPPEKVGSGKARGLSLTEGGDRSRSQLPHRTVWWASPVTSMS